MNTLEDIDQILRPGKPYGVEATHQIFAAEKNLNFPGADAEWNGIGGLCDEVLRRIHGIDGGRNTLATHDHPFALHFRQTYGPALAQCPATIEECQTALTDMMETLFAIRSLHDIVPFETRNRDKFLLERVRNGIPAHKHIEEGDVSMLDLEQHTIADWNNRRISSKQQPLSPWTKNTFAQIVDRTDRKDVHNRRLFLNGEMRTMGQCVLRNDIADQRTFELIDYAADAQPGLADLTVVQILSTMNAEGRMRLKNVVEEAH